MTVRQELTTDIAYYQVPDATLSSEFGDCGITSSTKLWVKTVLCEDINGR